MLTRPEFHGEEAEIYIFYRMQRICISMKPAIK